jgi:hypothetical protein
MSTGQDRFVEITVHYAKETKISVPAHYSLDETREVIRSVINQDTDLSSIIIASGDFPVISTALPLTKKSFQRIWGIYSKCPNWANRIGRWTSNPRYRSYKDSECPIEEMHHRGNFLSLEVYPELMKSCSRDFVIYQSILTRSRTAL